MPSVCAFNEAFVLIYDCHNVVIVGLKLWRKKKQQQNGPDLEITKRENHTNFGIENIEA